MIFMDFIDENDLIPFHLMQVVYKLQKARLLKVDEVRRKVEALPLFKQLILDVLQQQGRLPHASWANQPGQPIVDPKVRIQIARFGYGNVLDQPVEGFYDESVHLECTPVLDPIIWSILQILERSQFPLIISDLTHLYPEIRCTRIGS